MTHMNKKEQNAALKEASI